MGGRIVHRGSEVLRLTRGSGSLPRAPQRKKRARIRPTRLRTQEVGSTQAEERRVLRFIDSVYLRCVVRSSAPTSDRMAQPAQARLPSVFFLTSDEDAG